jgi:hypothetical protein
MNHPSKGEKMSKRRKYEYHDISLMETQIKRLLQGYVVIKHITNGKGNKVGLCITNNSRDRKIQRQILKLKQKIVKLENGRRFRKKRVATA